MSTGSDAAANFARQGTIGIEEEFYVVDERGRPVSGTDELVYESTPPEILQGRLDHELFKCVIETQTPVCADLAEAREQLAAVRAALVAHAEAHGYRIAAAGLHPAARWRELEHAEKPRYRSQLDRIQYPQHRNTTAGLHVHVGVDDAEKATWIADELRWYLPPILALSANSPFWNGHDTGLASARAKIFEGLPNTGMPTTFGSFETYLDFESTMVAHGSVADRGELWFDVRPHTEHGTVEVRTPDAHADRETTFAFVEYVHALVLDLAAAYETGADRHHPRREILDENKWRALRHGHDATFLRRDLDGVLELAAVVEREADRLDVEGIRDVHDAESGTARQRRLHDHEGLDAACEDLVL